jgi:hypothetical protein
LHVSILTQWLSVLVAGFPPQRPEFDPRSGYVVFVMDKVVLGQVFSEYFCFPCQFSFHPLLHTHLSSGAATEGKIVADVPSGLSLTPPQETKQAVTTICSTGSDAQNSIHFANYYMGVLRFSMNGCSPHSFGRFTFVTATRCVLYDLGAGSCEHGDEPSSSIIWWESASSTATVSCSRMALLQGVNSGRLL